MASTDAPPAEPTDEQLARLVLRALSAVVVLTLAAGVAAAAVRLDEGEGVRPSPTEATRPLSPRGGIGPLPGTSVVAYERARDAVLDDVQGRRTAVVSLGAYETSAEARARLAAVEVVRLLVAVPGGRPAEAVTDADVAALTARQREEAMAERAALQQLLPTVEDPDFRRQYTEDIARLTALLAAPPVDEVVYAAVVVAPADRLRALAAAPGVRLVDVGSSAVPPRPGAVSGLRPEEQDRAGQPAARPTT